MFRFGNFYLAYISSKTNKQTNQKHHIFLVTLCIQIEKILKHDNHCRYSIQSTPRPWDGNHTRILKAVVQRPNNLCPRLFCNKPGPPCKDGQAVFLSPLLKHLLLFISTSNIKWNMLSALNYLALQ